MSLPTCRSRIGSGISSPPMSGNPFPSHRAKTYSSAAWMPAPRSSQPANRCATSHIAANDSRPLAAFASTLLDERGADLRRTARPDVGAVERKHLRRVGGVDQEERCAVLDVVAEELRRLVPVRRASGGVEERDVVRCRRAPPPRLPRARRAGLRAQRCGARARAAARSRGRSRARGHRPPRRPGSAARSRADPMRGCFVRVNIRCGRSRARS